MVGIIAGLIGLCGVLVATVLAGENFSWSSNALSDLGVSPVADIFNYSLIITGILNFFFAIGFLKAHSKNTLFYVGGSTLVLGSSSLSLVGVFTEAYGNLHICVSLGYFFLLPIAMLLIGFAFLKTGMRNNGYVSILAGLIALLVILLGIAPGWHTWLGLGFAAPEITEALAIGAWIMWMAANLIRKTC